jgi:hypothetical protein
MEFAIAWLVAAAVLAFAFSRTRHTSDAERAHDDAEFMAEARKWRARR